MGHEFVEHVAALVIVFGGLTFIVASVRRATAVGGPVRLGMHPEPTDATPSQLVWSTTAGCSIGAAIIHFALAPGHFAEAGALGAGFLIAGVLQAGTALLMWSRRTEWVAWVAISLNLVLIAAWAWSRTVGLPFGEEPFRPESIGRADIVAVSLETAIVALLLGWMRARRRNEPDRPSAYASVGMVPAVGIVAVFTILALAGLGDSHDHDHTHSGRVEGRPGVHDGLRAGGLANLPGPLPSKHVDFS